MEAWKYQPPLTPENSPNVNAYQLVLTFYLPDMLNATYGQPGGAKTRFKRIDVSGLVKIVEDLIVEMTGIDDSNNVRLYLEKTYSEEAGVGIALWQLTDEHYISPRLRRFEDV